MSLVLSNKGKGMQSSSEQPLVGEERYVTTRITAAKETTSYAANARPSPGKKNCKNIPKTTQEPH